MISPSSTNVEVTRQGRLHLPRVLHRLRAGQSARPLRAKRSPRVHGRHSGRREERLQRGARPQLSRELHRSAEAASFPRVKYSEGDSDFSAQLTPFAPSSPDVLFIPGYYTDAGLIARQARALGIEADASRAATVGTLPSSSRSGAAPSKERTFRTTIHSTTPHPRSRSSSAPTRSAYGSEPDSIAALSYDAVVPGRRRDGARGIDGGKAGPGRARRDARALRA